MEHTRTLSIAVLLSLLVGALPARAEPVVVLPVRGTLPVDDLVDLEERTIAAIEAAGHAAFGERGALDTTDSSRPETANELRAVAEMQNANYALDPSFEPAPGNRIRAVFRVGYVPETRVEELEFDLPRDDPDPMLRQAVALLLRPEGAGPDAPDQLLAAEAARQAAIADAARVRAEDDARARQEAEEARLAAEAAEREASRPKPYAAGRPWMVGAGFAARPIIARPDNALGGTLGAVELVAGRHFERARGLEARASAELYFGAASAFALTVGAVYMLQPFGNLPLFLGPGVDVGWAQHTSGPQEASLLLRAKPVIAYRFSDGLTLEASLPEIQWFSADGGSAVLGFAARLQARF